MDIDKFIDDNIEEILDNPAFFISEEQNTKENRKVVNIYEGEDLEEQDDLIDILDVHEMLEKKKEAIKNHDNHDNLENPEDPEYYFKLINIFMKYYNDKYNKNENLFSNIENKFKDTNSALELFFEAIMEFNDLKEKFNMDGPSRASSGIDAIDLLDKYYDYDSKEIINLMNSYEQVYCLEINEDNINCLEDKKKIITISLIICLNYVLVNKIEKWNIFILKSY
jgi:hypothetical protein